MSLARGAYDQESVPHVGDEATRRYGPFIEAHIARRAHEWLTRPVDELDALLLDGRKRLHGPRARRSKLSDAGMLGPQQSTERACPTMSDTILHGYAGICLLRPIRS